MAYSSSRKKSSKKKKKEERKRQKELDARLAARTTPASKPKEDLSIPPEGVTPTKLDMSNVGMTTPVRSKSHDIKTVDESKRSSQNIG